MGRVTRLLTAALLAGASVAVAPGVPAPAVAGETNGSAIGGSVPGGSVVVEDVRSEELTIPVRPEPDGSPVTIDATVVRPERDGRNPALLLAHGLGGSKSDLLDEARRYAERGYLVVAYTARGFGRSGGRVHLDDPDFEIADARALIDTVAARGDVQLDGAGDPRVGIAGGSYGGALALMTAALDPRVDAIVAAITWHDLAAAFFPQAGRTGDPGAPGVFKQLWASRFFVGAAGASQPTPPAATLPAASPAAGPLCGRYDPAICAGFLEAATTGRPSEQLLATLRRNSPAQVASQIRAPTLLVQGMADSLFGLDQSDATARALQASGTPVAVRWMDGGHDAGSTTATQDEAAADAWFDRYLTDAGRARSGLPVPAFVYAGPKPRRAASAPLYAADRYPGIVPGPDAQSLPLTPAAGDGPGARLGALVSPPGGQPSSVTGIPGLAQLGAGVPSYQLAALPGQFVAFDSAAAPARATVAGSPTVRLRVTSSATDATLFVSLWQVTSGNATLGRRLVAPVRVATTPGRPVDVEVTLPAGTYTVEPGSTWRVLVASSDNLYAVPRDARLYSVVLADPVLRLPVVPGSPVPVEQPPDRESQIAGGGLAALAVLAGVVALRRRRNRPQPLPGSASVATSDDPRPATEAVGQPATQPVGRPAGQPASRPAGQPATETAGQPATDPPAVSARESDVVLAVQGLSKTYPDGHRAVQDVSWEARRGQVVGLLGPNGSGKTTTMRMVVGLIHPTGGTAAVLGEPVVPGADVLRRVGVLVEGPGFLPHLSGRANLDAFWAATGRPRREAGFDEALAVAALGDAIDRPVRSYSHGMKQRLGIAQAMLGTPDLLILDEPTNGLDPPQIAAMRPILRAYAAAGRTVVVSSHLLAEVEMTCSHVVVMHQGRVLAAGSVDELLAAGGDGSGRRHLEDVFLGVISGDPQGGAVPADTLRQVRAR